MNDWYQYAPAILGSVAAIWLFFEKVLAPVVLRDWVADRQVRRDLAIKELERKQAESNTLTQALKDLTVATNEVSNRLPLIVPTITHSIEQALSASLNKHELTHVYLRDTNATLNRIADQQERSQQDLSVVRASLVPNSRRAQSRKKHTEVTLPPPQTATITLNGVPAAPTETPQ